MQTDVTTPALVKVSPEMIAAFVNWEPPCELDVTNPARALGLIRAAYFAGWIAALRPADHADTLAGELLADAIATHRGFIAQKPDMARECLDSLLGTLDGLAALSTPAPGFAAGIEAEPSEAMIAVGAHALSEWLNDNAPIGEAMYRSPAKAAWKAMHEAALSAKGE